MKAMNKLDAFVSQKWFVSSAQCLLAMGPFAALSGNAGSDVWLGGVAVAFLVYCSIYGKWDWVKEPWFILALTMWVWLVFTSLISDWPGESLTHSLTWIRFPLFAAAFAFFTRYSPTTRKLVFVGFMVGLAIMMAVLVHERLTHPDVVRLYGTWNQHTKAGWYMIGYGLPVSLWALGKMKGVHILWAAPLVILIIACTVTTGEIYVSMSLIFGIFLVFFLDNFSNWKRLLALGTLVAAPLLLVLAFSPLMRDRFIFGIQERLPWLPSSDYYPAWMGGYRVGLMNPITGVGADNYDRFCLRPEIFEKLNIVECLSHPHQMYIQAFSEAGIVGFTIFVMMVLAAFLKVLPLSNKLAWTKFHTWMPRQDKLFSSQAIGLVIVAFWPISTYSEAFGQHKNFFTWLAVGWAFSFVQRYWSEKNPA